MLFKRFKYITILAVTAVFLLVGAFFLGTVVSADITGSPAPGSAEDPLVSESYVKAKVAALEARIAELEQQVAGTSSTNSSKGNSSSSSNSGSGSNNNSSNSSSNNSSNSSSTGGSSTNQPASPSAKMVQIKQLSTYANVRSTPNMQAQVMIRVNPGSQLTWLKTSGEWYNVRLSDGRSGWVHNSVAELR